MELVMWNYEKSVNKMRPLVIRWRDCTVEMMEELYQAREELSSRYYRDGTNVPSWGKYCEDIGLEKRTANRWLSSYNPETRQIEDKSTALVSKFTGNNENYTPENIIENINNIFGEIDLDPASCKLAQKKIKAKNYFTEKENGLLHEWHGNVFLNPPYKYPLIEDFINKLISELPNIKSAILLTNNNTDTQWFRKAAEKSSAICFTTGRINFYTETIDKTMPTNGQCFFYFGNNENKFIQEFSKTGIIMRVL